LTHLKVRTITGLVAAPAVLLLVIFGQSVGFKLLVVGIVLVGVWECRRLLEVAGAKTYWILCSVCGVGVTLCGGDEALRGPVLLVTFLVIVSRGLASKDEPSSVLNSVALSVFMVMLIPFCASFAVGVRLFQVPSCQVDLGLRLAILLFVATWASDTCAYFVGRSFGRHKLHPRISPGKTLEGFAGGSLGCALATMALGYFLVGIVPLWQWLVLGLVLGTVGQIGDLSASLIKRAAGVKDAGGLLPGHGGVLDRMDSFLFNSPAVYIFARIVFAH